jgi:hypothetical protein
METCVGFGSGVDTVYQRRLKFPNRAKRQRPAVLVGVHFASTESTTYGALSQLGMHVPWRHCESRLNRTSSKSPRQLKQEREREERGTVA